MCHMILTHYKLFKKKSLHKNSYVYFIFNNKYEDKKEKVNKYLRSALIPSIVLVNLGFPVSVAVNASLVIFVSVEAAEPLIAVSYELEDSEIFSLLYSEDDALRSARDAVEDDVST